MNKRKTVLFLLSVLLAGWAVYSCSMDELEAPAFEDSGRYGGFGAREARAYFEANATDLSVPCFDPKPGSKSSWRDNIELIPEWGEAIETGHSAVSLIEVPLKSYTDNIGKEILVENGEYGKDHQQELTRRLIIARHDTCQTDMFIITIVPSMDYGGDVVKSVEDFRYLGGGDFTGYVFCSTLEGKFFKAFSYTDGKSNGRLNVATKSQLEYLRKVAPESIENCVIFRFQELPRLSQKTYTKSSDWPDDWCSHGCPPGGCETCSPHGGSGGSGSGSGSGWQPGDGDGDDTTIDYELGEVIVPGTRLCPGGCKQPINMCTCLCDCGSGKYKRVCTCAEYPAPDPEKDKDPTPVPDPEVGGENQGGGEGNGSVNPAVSTRFSNASSLGLQDREKLNEALEQLLGDCVYGKIDAALTKDGLWEEINLEMQIDENSQGVGAITKQNVFKFGGVEHITAGTIAHEWIHLYQRYLGGVDVFDSSFSGMAEFEVALFQDIVIYLGNKGENLDRPTDGIIGAPSWTGNLISVPGGNSMRREYMAWLKEICKDNKVPTAIDQASFMEWCKYFGTYSAYSRLPYNYENESYGTGILMSLLEIIHDCF